MTPPTWNPLLREQVTWHWTTQLHAEHAPRPAGIEALGGAGLPRPCGEAGEPFAELPVAALVRHVDRELIHHLAEVYLIRNLYRHARRPARAGS